MAAMTTADKERCARILGNRIYVEPSVTANLHHADLVAAVSAVDSAMEGTPATLPNQASSITINLNTILPEPFKATATQPQKSMLLACWAAVKYGAI